MTNGTYTGQTDWRVGGVSKVYRSEVIPLSFKGGKNGADCYSKNGHAVTVLTRQS